MKNSNDRYAESLKPDACAFCNKKGKQQEQQGDSSSCSDEEKVRLRKCTRCLVSMYCSVDCQRNDWKARHGKKKGECERLKAAREFWINDAEAVVAAGEEAEDANATSLFIIAARLGLGQNGDPRDPKYAIELYKKAAELNTPINGGHPNAMIHLAVHYERGIGTEQDYAQAFHWYNRVLQHKGGDGVVIGEENIHSALVALSRFYKEGLGGVVEPSEEDAIKYATLSQSNPESSQELKGMLEWWEANKSNHLPKS